MDNRHLFNRKSLKSLRSYLRNKSTSAESVFNHPGRESRIVNISKSAIPATPPSKGGETFVSKTPWVDGYAFQGGVGWYKRQRKCQ